MIAKVIRKSFNDTGTRLPSRASTPGEGDVGGGQVPTLKATGLSRLRTSRSTPAQLPPMAAAPGRTLRRLRRLTVSTSRFFHFQAYEQEKHRHQASLIHSSGGLAIFNASCATTGVSSRPVYSHDGGELMIIRARMPRRSFSRWQLQLKKRVKVLRRVRSLSIESSKGGTPNPYC